MAGSESVLQEMLGKGFVGQHCQCQRLALIVGQRFVRQPGCLLQGAQVKRAVDTHCVQFGAFDGGQRTVGRSGR